MANTALFLIGGWDGHQPQACAERFAPLLQEAGLTVEMRHSPDALCDQELLSRCRLIVPCWTMGKISYEQSQAVQIAVQRGCGLGGWHGGMCDAFREDVTWQWMTGGQFIGHPGGIIPYRIELTNLDHPITRGLSAINLVSEQYYMHVDPGVQVLATTTFSGAHANMDWLAGTVMPAAWTKHWGAGRVFYCSAGHVASDFDNPQLTELVRRGLLWAANLR